MVAVKNVKRDNNKFKLRNSSTKVMDQPAGNKGGAGSGLVS